MALYTARNLRVAATRAICAAMSDKSTANTPPSNPLHLGQTSSLPASPEEAVLDYVPNPRAGATYLVRFAAPEFTSLCPVTGAPDFAHLVIDYAPAETIVESKSLKLFAAAMAATPLGNSSVPSAPISISVIASARAHCVGPPRRP